MLWSAFHYPRLALEHGGAVAGGRPRAIVVRSGSRRTVHLCDDAARSLGIRVGLPLGDALALVPSLSAEPLDERALSDALDQLTLQALGYSSRVVPCPPDTVLAETGGSLRLFGGLDALLGRVRDDALAQGLTLSVGTAPTPAAAELLARVGDGRAVRSTHALGATLAEHPLEALAPLGLAATAIAGLRRSGLRRIGELRALPPAAVGRRFGRNALALLERLDGRRPDPRRAFVPPPTFAAAHELPLEASGTAELAFVLNRLFGALGGFLRSRDLGARALALRLCHRRSPPSVVALRFGAATDDAAHLRGVALERLERLVLAAPVTRVALETDELAELAPRTATLLDDGAESGAAGRAPLGAVVDRLVARLGERSIYTTLPHDDHRPEKAWTSGAPELAGTASHGRDRTRDPGGGRHDAWRTSLAARAPRPLWLLREPRVAREPLTLLPGTERIENGWWEESDVRRDYFIARDARGTHYWVFRLRHDPGTLWIHGLFA